MTDQETPQIQIPEDNPAAPEVALLGSTAGGEDIPPDGPEPAQALPAEPANADEIGHEEPVPEGAAPAEEHEPGTAAIDAGQLTVRIDNLERQMAEAQDKTRYLRRIQSLREQLALLPPEESAGLAPRLDTVEAACHEQLEENLRRKDLLVARAEELSTSEDWKAAADEIKGLQAQWKTIGAVPQERSQELWQRFRKAGNTFFERRQQHLQGMGQQQEENLEKKEALCARAEELSQSTQWRSTADAFKALQAEWKAVGPVPREHSETLWQRFRQAADAFFGRRSEHYSKLRKDQTENLRKKDALCVRAEELSQSTQWKATSEAIKVLQAEWKAIGPVPQNKADAIWKRFRGAIDVFFERQKAWFDQRNQDRESRQTEWRDQLHETLDRKRDQIERLRESMGRDEENVQRWQATLADLRPGPRAEEIRAGLVVKITDVESRLASKRERLRELESSIEALEVKVGMAESS